MKNKKLEEITNEIGMSLSELAKDTGLSYEHIRNVFLGKTKMEVKDLVVIVRYTKRTPEEILEILGL